MNRTIHGQSVAGNSNVIDDNRDDDEFINFKESKSTELTSINNDCLREICKYLNIFEVVNLATTCTRLQTFAVDFWYPKIASKIQISLTHWSTVPVRTTSIDLHMMMDLKKPFERFGSAIEQLTLRGSYQRDLTIIMGLKCASSFRKLLVLCPNLQSLCIQDVSFISADASILDNVTPSLKELKFERCTNIGNNWSAAFKRLSQIETISVTGRNRITALFFMDTLNLRTLTIDYDSLRTHKDLEKVFNQNGHGIRHLKLINFSKLLYFQSIRTLIVEKLPMLEHLSIETYNSVTLTNLLTELPHLRSLRVRDGYAVNLNSLLRKIVELGTIEDLNIDGGFVDGEVENGSPLNFGKLQSIHWQPCFKQDPLVLFKALTRCQMPAIKCFSINLRAINLITHGSWEMLAFFESKTTLRSIAINGFTWNTWINADRNRLILGIIDILKRNRPFLNLTIYPLVVETELVSKISSHFLFIVLKMFFFSIFTDDSAEKKQTSD